MSAIDDRFSQLKQQGKKAFIPFVTAGDPSLGRTQQVLKLLDQCGSAIAEVGIPYSDPIADGPVIQASYTRALDAGVKLDDILSSLREIVPQLSLPLITMVSYSIVQRVGLQRYVSQAIDSGVAGAIVPDLLVEEASEFRTICRNRDFSLIPLVTPTTPKDRMLRIAEAASGFIYFVSVTGITGERNELPPQLLDTVSWLREQTPTPVCIGFGISRVEHVRMLGPVSDGLIVGSAIVRRLHEDAQASDPLAGVQRLAQDLINSLNQ